MKRVIPAVFLTLLMTATPISASALSSFHSSSSGFHSSVSHSSVSSHASSGSSHVSSPSSTHSSSSESESHSSTPSSSSSSRSSSTRSTGTPSYHATTYNGRTYNQNSSSNSYFNVSGLLIAYWIYNSSNHSYSCYDSNHNETSCNRNKGTVTHGGQTYSVSDKAYTDTDNKTVSFYQKKQNAQKKTYYECFDSGYTRVSCNRK